jgi:hypothetical protein
MKKMGGISISGMPTLVSIPFIGTLPKQSEEKNVLYTKKIEARLYNDTKYQGKYERENERTLVMNLSVWFRVF